MLSIKEGEKIPLIFQAYDGKEDLRVIATLFSINGVKFRRVKLNSFGNGLYVDQSLEMPKINLIMAQYESNSPDYEIVYDSFKLDVDEELELEKELIIGTIEENKKIILEV